MNSKDGNKNDHLNIPLFSFQVLVKIKREARLTWYNFHLFILSPRNPCALLTRHRHLSDRKEQESARGCSRI